MLSRHPGESRDDGPFCHCEEAWTQFCHCEAA